MNSSAALQSLLLGLTGGPGQGNALAGQPFATNSAGWNAAPVNVPSPAGQWLLPNVAGLSGASLPASANPLQTQAFQTQALQTQALQTAALQTAALQTAALPALQ